MQLAIKEATEAFARDEVPVGVVIVSEGKVLAKARNMTEALKDVTAHAEMMAITSAAERLGGKFLSSCTMYVTLEPCVMCAGALYWARLQRLVFAASDEMRGFRKIGSSILHPKTEVVTGLMAEECRSLMQDFFKGKR